MKLFYIVNARIPTEKAHGVTIMNACEAFGREGVETTLIVPRRKNPMEGDPFMHYGVEETFKIKQLWTLDLFRYQKTIGKLAFWLQVLSFYFSVGLFLLFKNRRTIVYVRDYGSPLLRLMGYKIIYECHHISNRRRLFFFLNKFNSKVVVISKALKQAFLDEGMKEKDILVGPSGVDLSVFAIDVTREEARKRLSLPNDPIIGLYTGNFKTMGEEKGIANCIRSLAHTDKNIMFVAAGGTDEYRAEYQAMAEELGVDARVRLLGRMKQDEFALYQRAANALLMPFPDTPHYRHHMSPIKMFEYMASARPIIATDLPTITEVLNSDTAYIVEPDSPEAIARALCSVKSNPDQAEKIGTAGHALVQEYEWAPRAKRVISFINS